MFNITDTVQVLRDVETVLRNDTVLTKDDRDLLLVHLSQKLNESTPHGRIVIAAIERARGRFTAAPEEQGRKTEGQQDAPEVAPKDAEASGGSTQGKQEQAEDPRSVPGSSNGNRAAPKASAKAKK